MSMMLGVLAGAAGADELAAAKATFQKADKELNAVYQELKKGLEENLFAEVQEDQRGWIEYRDYIAGWDSEAAGKAPTDDPRYFEVAAELTEIRVAWLKAWKGVGERGDWSGTYSDSYGGLLEIVERGGKLFFTLNVVRGPTAHIGVIGGEAAVNGTLARFSIVPEGETRPTWLSFLNNRKGDGRIEVIGQNTHWFHGVRAYFDGFYLRVGLLDAKAADKVVASAKRGGEPE